MPSIAATPTIAAKARSSWDHPVIVGLALLVAPPIGAALVWTNPRLDREAKIALTAMSALSLIAGALIAGAVVAVRVLAL